MASREDELLPNLPRSWAPLGGAPGSGSDAVQFITDHPQAEEGSTTREPGSGTDTDLRTRLKRLLTEHGAELVGGVTVAALVIGLLSGKVQFACSKALSKRMDLPAPLHGLLLLLAKIPSLVLAGDVYIVDERDGTVARDTLLERASADGTLLWLLDGYGITSFRIVNGVFSCSLGTGLDKEYLLFFARKQSSDGVVYEFLDNVGAVRQLYGVQRSIHQLEGHHVRYIAGIT